MDLQELYANCGGSYDEAINRLRKEELVKKYLKLFLADESYEQTIAAAENADWQQCFSASHNLKGVAANLSLDNLQHAASDICEACRNGAPEGDVSGMVEAVKASYAATVEAIQALE